MSALFSTNLDPGHRRVCLDCGAPAPETNTNYTLISSKFGWRLTRRVDPSGRKILEWRCPPCWDIHKQQAPSSRSGR